MSWTRTEARRVVNAIRLPVAPTEERTLYVEGVPRNIGTERDCLCRYIANYVSRAALENGCTKVVIRRSPQHRHEFDVIDLARHAEKVNGGLRGPSMARPPRFLATRGHEALGNTFDTSRFLIRVPVTIGGTSPAISGDDAGGKG